jgi:hypothetical protein
MLKVGDLVEARAGTLAHFCGDKWGTVEAFDSGAIMVRMDTSGRLVPFKPEQLDPIHRPSRASRSTRL